MRRQGDDGVRVREREAETRRRQRVDDRRCRGATVAAEGVGAQGVDRDEEDVLLSVLSQVRARRPPSAREPRRSGYYGSGKRDENQTPHRRSIIAPSAFPSAA